MMTRASEIVRPAPAASAKMDFSKPLDWSNWAVAEEQFFQLTANPPLHSVVINIAPKVASELLKMTNTRNRRLRADKAKSLGEHVVATGNFEVTGDTIKFDKDGNLLDGQHRLTACAASPVGLVSHVVFGLPPAIFDSLDLGAKRTVADALDLEGHGNPFIMSGALNFIRRYEAGQGGSTGGARSMAITPREAISLLNSKYSGVAKWCKAAERIQKIYKHPPSIVCGVLYLAEQKSSEKRVKEFVEAWVSGTRDGPNKNFDELARRIHSIRASNNGAIHRGTIGALAIITWNYWHAGLPVTPRAMSWSRSSKFPEVEGNSALAARKARSFEAQNTSLNAACLRVLQSVRRHSDSHGICAAPAVKIAQEAAVPPTQVRYLLNELVRDGFATLVEQGGRGPGSASKYSVTAKGFMALTKAPLPDEKEDVEEAAE